MVCPPAHISPCRVLQLRHMKTLQSAVAVVHSTGWQLPSQRCSWRLTSWGIGASVNMAVAHSPGSCDMPLRSSCTDCSCFCFSHSAAAAAATREGVRLAGPDTNDAHSTCNNYHKCTHVLGVWVCYCLACAQVTQWSHNANIMQCAYARIAPQAVKNLNRSK
jgi:hypothetical protein